MSTVLSALRTAYEPLKKGDILTISGTGFVMINTTGREKRVNVLATAQDIGPYEFDGDLVITAGTSATTYSISREAETQGSLPVTYNPETAQLRAGGEDISVGGDGSGDVVGPASSSNGELPLFSGTGGKTLKRSNTLNGLVKLTAGVVSEAVEGVDYAAPGAASNAYFPAGW